MQRFLIGLGQKQTYDLNGVHYEVSGRFTKDKAESRNTIRTRLERILQNPVHLTLLPELCTIDTESVDSTAGKE